MLHVQENQSNNNIHEVLNNNIHEVLYNNIHYVELHSLDSMRTMAGIQREEGGGGGGEGLYHLS